MKIVYFGTSDFAVPALGKLAEHVVLVVTQPDRPSGRGMKLKSSPVKQKAQELGLPVETPEKARDPEFVERIRALEADIHVVAAYGQILSTKLLETAKRGGINLHGSILPEYRGAAPIQRAIMDGRTETGVTLMQMDKGMDTGDIINIVKTPIGPNETYGLLHTRLSHLAAAQIDEWVIRIFEGNYPRIAQDSARATYAAKIGTEERLLSFDQTTTSFFNKFRGLNPSPGAQVQIGTAKAKVVDCEPTETKATASPGTILNSNPLTVATMDGGITLHRVCPEGRSPQSGAEWARAQLIETF